ncbi:TPA: hypothetical protein NJ652_004470 [Vibrio parahaemolyticus]|nr:hypothetical protein [Vibrio parahaemolyticus]
MKRVKYDFPEGGESKATILLIHGTAPIYFDGKIPACSTNYKLGCMPTYEMLANELTKRSFSTLRYLRDGVYQDEVRWDEYIDVDHYQIVTQLQTIVSEMPSDKPKVLFAFSGGSIHVSKLDLSDVAGVVIVGGLSTNRFHNAAMNVSNKEEWQDFQKEVESFKTLSEPEIDKINKPNWDGPLKRFWQEIMLNDNWTYFQKHVHIPMLILHGSDDVEVNKSQARLWKELLPFHNIKSVEINGGDHFLNTSYESGASIISREIESWVAENGIV